MVVKKIKAAEEEAGVVGGGELSKRPKEKEYVELSTSFPNWIAVDENFLTMCREIGWSTNVSRDALTALKMLLDKVKSLLKNVHENCTVNKYSRMLVNSKERGKVRC